MNDSFQKAYSICRALWQKSCRTVFAKFLLDFHLKICLPHPDGSVRHKVLVGFFSSKEMQVVK